MGLASYYRRFMRGFASNVAPFHCLMGKGKELVWNPECDMAFSSLKRLLTTATTLANPHFENEFVIDCDASGGGLGAVLSQSIDDVEHVISFASRPLEQKYCTIRKERLALIWSINQFIGWLSQLQASLVSYDEHQTKQKKISA